MHQTCERALATTAHAEDLAGAADQLDVFHEVRVCQVLQNQVDRLLHSALQGLDQISYFEFSTETTSLLLSIAFCLFAHYELSNLEPCIRNKY